MTVAAQDEPLTATPYLRPAEVAERLGISTAMLRRHAAKYEEVFGELPKSSRDGRLYPPEVLERLEASLAMFRTQRVVSVEAGLEALARGEEAPAEALAKASEPQPLELLLEELRRLRETVETQNQLLRAQDERMLALEGQFKALESGNSKEAELERRVKYLSDELERRNTEEQRPRRSWWKFWVLSR